jgi:transposase
MRTRRNRMNISDFQDELIVAATKSMPKTQVARKFGVAVNTVYEVLKRVKADSPMVSDYVARRAEISAWNQLKRQEKQVDILDTIKQEDIENASLKTKMVMLNTLGLDKNREFEMERLENNQSTANVGIVMKHILDIKERERLKEENGDNSAELNEA